MAGCRPKSQWSPLKPHALEVDFLQVQLEVAKKSHEPPSMTTRIGLDKDVYDVCDQGLNQVSLGIHVGLWEVLSGKS